MRALEWARKRVAQLEEDLTIEKNERKRKKLQNQLIYAKEHLEREEALEPGRQERREALQQLRAAKELKEIEKVTAEAQELQGVRETGAKLPIDTLEARARELQRKMKFPVIQHQTLKGMINAWTNDGADILKLMVAVLYDDPTKLPGEHAQLAWPRGQQPNIEHRMSAADWLASRLWGRPVQIARIDTTERKQLELVWGDAGLPERTTEEIGDETLIAPIEAEFRPKDE